VPLYDDDQCAALGWPAPERGLQIAMFLDAYGLRERCHLFDVLRLRQHASADTIAAKADEGDDAYRQLVAQGRLAEIAANIEYAARSRNEWARFLK
jgi:hypothetical protein